MVEQPDLFGPKHKWCAYCGGHATTSSHVPGKLFLDEPFPVNLLSVSSCERCNNGLSNDEQFLMCLIDSVLSGAAGPAEVRRLRSRKTLERDLRLSRLVHDVMEKTPTGVIARLDPDRLSRVSKVLRFIAAGHLARATGRTTRPDSLLAGFMPLETMTEPQKVDFERGQRHWQEQVLRRGRLLVQANAPYFVYAGVVWCNVQDSRYRYSLVKVNKDLEVRFVFSEFLACRVWRNPALPSPAKRRRR